MSGPLFCAALLLVPLVFLFYGEARGAALIGGLDLITIVFAVLPVAGWARAVELRADRLVVRRFARRPIDVAWGEIDSLAVRRRMKGVTLSLRTRDRRSASTWISERWMSNFGQLERELRAHESVAGRPSRLAP